jgi:large subunit ribosomal protein L31
VLGSPGTPWNPGNRRRAAIEPASGAVASDRHGTTSTLAGPSAILPSGSHLMVDEEPCMKSGIHPEYYQARVTCACGETFVTGSTKKSIRVEICSKCHPFYTGTRKFVDAEGRVQKFARKYGIKVQ